MMVGTCPFCGAAVQITTKGRGTTRCRKCKTWLQLENGQIKGKA